MAEEPRNTNYKELLAGGYVAILVPRAASRTMRSYFPSWLWHATDKVYQSRIHNQKIIDRDIDHFQGNKAVACVRSPYTRMVSLWKSIKVAKRIRLPRLAPRMPFDEFIDIIRDNIYGDVHYQPPSSYIPEETTIVKLEDFKEDMQKYNDLHEEINIAVESVCAQVVGFTGAAPTLEDVMTPEIERIIQDIYSSDFERFGYENNCL